jgi:hypothetical protein
MGTNVETGELWPTYKVLPMVHLPAIITFSGRLHIFASLAGLFLAGGTDLDRMLSHAGKIPVLIDEVLKMAPPDTDPECEILIAGWSASRGRMLGMSYSNYQDAGFSEFEVRRDYICPGYEELRHFLPEKATADDLLRLAREQIRITHQTTPRRIPAGPFMVAEITRERVTIETVAELA